MDKDTAYQFSCRSDKWLRSYSHFYVFSPLITPPSGQAPRRFRSYERFRTFDRCSASVRPSLGNVVDGVSTTFPPSFKSLHLTVWSAWSVLGGDRWSLVILTITIGFQSSALEALKRKRQGRASVFYGRTIEVLLVVLATAVGRCLRLWGGVVLVIVGGVGILSRLTGVGGALSERGREIPERQIKQVEKQENQRIKTNDTSEITSGLIFSHKAAANMPNFYLTAGQYLSRSISALKYEKM